MEQTEELTDQKWITLWDSNPLAPYLSILHLKLKPEYLHACPNGGEEEMDLT